MTTGAATVTPLRRPTVTPPNGINPDQLAAYVKRALTEAPPLSRSQVDALAAAWRPAVPVAGHREQERQAA